ncbi:NmrA/HSCARG family protein [Nocardia sp. NPDC127526]|uniref:NmrA/HSCARG family protein n=1 Tax=Nocardia sp. NPDC127526 TaxID=3345393 RepID=UPI00363F8771
MSTTKGPILVIGPTGQQGRAVAHHLLARGREVNAFVRNPESAAAQALRAAGATLVTGDLDDIDSVHRAMKDSYGVFLMLTMMSGVNITEEGIAAEKRRGAAALEVAAEVGIEHLVYSSLQGAGQDSGVPYYSAKELLEERIATLGLPATVLRPVFFMENFAAFNRPMVAPDGQLLVNLAVRADVPVNLISTDDIGAFAALAFDRPGDYRGRTLGIAGDRLLPPQIAELFGAAAGLPARSNQVPIEQVRAFDEQVAKMFEFFNSHPDDSIDIPGLRAVYPDLMDLRAWLHTSAAAAELVHQLRGGPAAV